jgi:hypothetical protein
MKNIKVYYQNKRWPELYIQYVTVPVAGGFQWSEAEFSTWKPINPKGEIFPSLSKAMDKMREDCNDKHEIIIDTLNG